MRTFVIGDIHGGLKALLQVLNQLELTEKDQLIFMGDFYFSVGVPRVLDTKQTKTENGLVSVVTDKPHLYSAMGYEFLVSKAEDIYLRPSVFTRIVTGAPMTTDFNTMVSFNRSFEIGATYRTNNAFAALLNLKLDDHFTTGWVYEVNSQSQYTNVGNSLEVLLMYQF